MRALLLCLSLAALVAGQGTDVAVSLTHIVDAVPYTSVRAGLFVPTPGVPFPEETGFAPGTQVVVEAAGIGSGTLFPPLGLEFISAADHISYFGEMIGPDASDPRVRAIIPPDIPEGEARLILYDFENKTSFGRVKIAPANFRILRTSGGELPLVADRLEGAGRERLKLTSPAIPGDTVSLRGSGLGRNPISRVEVVVGGVTVRPEWASFAPGTKGFEEVRFRMPAAAADGCYVPVQIRVAGVLSNTVRIPKMNSRVPCRHPMQLTLSELELLDAGRQIAVANLEVSNSIQVPTTVVRNPLPGFQGGSSFGGPAPVVSTVSQSSRLPAPGLRVEAMGAEQVAAMLPARVHGCAPEPVSWLDTSDFLTNAPSGVLDAGRTAWLQSPSGRRQLVQQPTLAALHFLEIPPLSYFVAGTWRISGQGGKDLESFDIAFQLPSVPAMPAGAVLPAPQPGRPLRVTWNRAGYTGADRMRVQFGSVACEVPATDGMVDVPTSAEPAPLFRAPVTLTVSREWMEAQSFRLRLTNGGAAAGLAGYRLTTTLGPSGPP